MSYRINFNKPYFCGREQEYIAEAVRLGHLSGDGTFTRGCQKILEEALPIARALLTTSCTHALEMSALLLDIQAGDEVIFPSFTFVSTVNAFVLRGARPVFADIRQDTLNIDEQKIESLISKRTKAIVPVHYAGVACEMDEIMRIARQYGIAVVEDNAHGLFGKYKGKYLGTFGCLATQSFHETKNFQCGEGGALMINDSLLIERAEIIREKGTNRSRFFRGQVDKYTWLDIGSSYVLSDILAACLQAQLESRDVIQAKRRYIWEFYQSHLSEFADSIDARLPVVPEYCRQTYHIFYLLMPSFEKRQALIEHLRSRGIMAVYHYLPLHNSPMGASLGGKTGDCPVTEDISDRLLRLPMYVDLSDGDMKDIVDAIKDCAPKASKMHCKFSGVPICQEPG